MLQNSTYGVKKVKGDPIFRIGSISKLLTVYSMPTEVGDAPVMDVIPELQSHVEKSKINLIEYVARESVTMGSLAGQAAGLPRYVVDTDLLETSEDEENSTVHGLPQLSQPQYPLCEVDATHPATGKSSSTRQLLRAPKMDTKISPCLQQYQLSSPCVCFRENCWKAVQKLFDRSIVKGLGLSDTRYDIPSSTEQGVILSGPSTSLWNARLVDSIPLCGMFSSPNDLTAIGRLILASTLLDTSTTRA